MPDQSLSELKARIKGWERAFRQENKREPTKDDVKADPNGIAQAYAAYKIASKAGNSGGLVPGPTAGGSSSSRLMAPPAIASSSKVPASGSSKQSSGSSSSSKVFSSTAKPSITSRAKAPASSSALASLKPNTSSASQPLKRKASTSELHTTPQKPRARLAVPSSPSNPFYAPSSGPGKESLDPSSASKFLYAASPQKLRATLSLTPRTRARKRLRGEDVGETPVKERQARRTWGRTSSSAALSDKSDEDDDEDEILGPSPARPKARDGKSFKPLFEAELKSLEGSAGQGDDLPFGGVKGGGKPPVQRKPSTSFFARAKASVEARAPVSASVAAGDVAMEPEEAVAPAQTRSKSRSRSRSLTGSLSPPASPTLDAAQSQLEQELAAETAKAITPPRTKTITLQTDFETGQEIELVIRPTRDVGRWKPPRERTPSPLPDEEEVVEVSVPQSLLGTLSLRSPVPASALQRRVDRKVEAIFKGHASKKSKEVDKSKLAEELVGDVDEDGLGDGEEEEGDDDWESEVEGWKLGGPGEVLSEEEW